MTYPYILELRATCIVDAINNYEINLFYKKIALYNWPHRKQD